ncbi:MAG: GtrA family protein [Kiritimatiellae bacterium]|nr:GtrA family protein [Kiritimatiellia bacterium]
MTGALGRFLSHDAGPFAQFVKYGAVGVASTLVHLAVFYALASTCLRCLTAEDAAVRFLGLPFAQFDGGEPWWASRWFLAAAATAAAFSVANVFCWALNRLFVFKPGKFPWFAEFALFYGAAAGATLVALLVQSALIRFAGATTSLAAIVEVGVSFAVNFVARRFFIFER